MIIECNYCETKVDAKILAEHQETDEWGADYKISLLECPVCKQALVACQEFIQVSPSSMDWTEPSRVWPSPPKYFYFRLPDLVKSSLEEAHQCYKAKAYKSCAVMCGGVIEAICMEFDSEGKTLKDKLKKLLEMRVIDKKIFEWAEALRLHRNIGAHASKEKISKDDANDLLEFTDAICNYIFVLSKRFEEFMQKKAKSKLSE